MIDLSPHAWSDIEDLCESDIAPFVYRRTVESRTSLREAIDRIAEIIDMERAGQIRASMRVSPEGGLNETR